MIYFIQKSCFFASVIIILLFFSEATLLSAEDISKESIENTQLSTSEPKPKRERNWKTTEEIAREMYADYDAERGLGIRPDGTYGIVDPEKNAAYKKQVEENKQKQATQQNKQSYNTTRKGFAPRLVLQHIPEKFHGLTNLGFFILYGILAWIILSWRDYFRKPKK